MQFGKEEIENEDSPLYIPINSAHLVEEKQNKEKGVFRIVQKDLSQTPSPTIFSSQAGCSQGYNLNNYTKYIDIDYNHTEAERAIQKKVNQDILNFNPSYLLNDYPQKKSIQDVNLQKTQNLNRKQQLLNNSFDTQQYTKKTNNFLNMEIPNLPKKQLKKRINDKRSRANQSLNESPETTKNKNIYANNSSIQQGQQNIVRDVNKTINVNPIMNCNTKNPNPSTATTSSCINSNINIDYQTNGIKNFQKILEPINLKKKQNYHDIQEFPQINIINKNSQNTFEKVMKSRPSVPDKISPKILQENLSNINSIKLNVRRKSSLMRKGVSQKIEDSFFQIRRNTSHQSSKENGFRGMTNDESGDELSFEGRYKQKQSNCKKQKIKFSKLNQGGGYRIYGEKEDIIFKTGLIANQKQIGSYSENSSPTYNVQTANINYRYNVGYQQPFNQQTPTVSYIGTNKTHTKVKLDEIKNVQIKQQLDQNIKKQLQNDPKEQQFQQNNTEKVEINDKQIEQNIISSEKQLVLNRKISNQEQDVIFEDENDGTLTINVDDIKLNAQQRVPFNSEEKIINNQSFHNPQNKNLQEDLEKLKEQTELFKKISISSFEDDSKSLKINENLENKLKNQGGDQLNDNQMKKYEKLETTQNNLEGDIKQIKEHLLNLTSSSFKQVQDVSNEYNEKKDEEFYQDNNDVQQILNQKVKQIKHLLLTEQTQTVQNIGEVKNNFEENYTELQDVDHCQTFQFLKEHINDELPQQQIIDLKYNISDQYKENNYQNQLRFSTQNNSKFQNEYNTEIFQESQQQKQDKKIQDNIVTNHINQIQNKSVDEDNHYLQNDQNQSILEQNQDFISCNFETDNTKLGINKVNSKIGDQGKQNIFIEQNSQDTEDELQDLYEEHFEELNEEEQETLQQQNQQNLKKQDKTENITEQDDKTNQNVVEEIPQYNQDENQSYNKINQDMVVNDIIQNQSDSSQSEQYIHVLADDDILKKIDLQVIILWEKQISEISSSFKSQNATKCYNSVVNFCSQYLILMRSHNFDSTLEVFIDSKSKKIIHNSITLERLGIIVLLHNYLDRKFFMNNINNIRNIASYIHLNFVLFVDLMIQKIEQNHPQLINIQEYGDLDKNLNQIKYPETLLNLISIVKDIASQNIYRKKINKSSEFLTAIKQNNEILLNLYKNITKHDKDFYNQIQLISKRIEKINSIEESFKHILNVFALYLTILENIIGFQPLPFLAVCPAPYLPPLQTIQQNNQIVKNIGNGNFKNDDDLGEPTTENKNNFEQAVQDFSQKDDKDSQDQRKISDLNIIQAQNHSKQAIKIQQKEQTNIGRQKNFSKQQKGNNNNIKRSTTPNSYSLNNNKNGTNQQVNGNRKQYPLPLEATIQQRRKSLSNSNSMNVVKNSKEEKSNPEKFREYTLVLDLDETLVHYSENNGGGQFVVRPFATQFLSEISEYYEIVVFTAAMPDYANWVLDNLDPNKLISHRLFRQHAVHIGNVFIKDLSRLGRSLEKTIIIDNVADNFQLQPENGIFIKGWFSDPHDKALSELLPLLKEMVCKNVPDVRKALKSLKEQMIQNIQNGIEFPHLNLKLD